MKYTLDLEKCVSRVNLLTPELLEILAKQIGDLTEEDLASLNTLKEKLAMESDNGL